MYPVVERIQLLFEKNNEKASQVFTNLGISSNALSEWKRGKAKPSSDAIVKIANYFDVSTDYLLTGTEKEIGLSQDEKEWLTLYNNLLLKAPKRKDECIDFIEWCIAKESKK